MSAPAKNKNGLKLKDPDVRQQAYEQYCAHLAKGKSKKSWCFEHPNPKLSCTWETMEKYIENAIEFDPIHKKIAETKGYAKWEQIVEDSAVGDNPDANTASLQMIMRNKFAWDRVKPDTSEHRGDIARLADELRSSNTFRSPEEGDQGIQ